MNSIITASNPTINMLRNDFFEKRAHIWDSRIRIADHEAIKRIFNKIHFSSNDTVIDVGSGTGITIPYYMEHGIDNIYACDNCSGMVEILKSKFPEIKIFHQSYLDPLRMNNSVDKIVIFNTFPHFISFEPIFRNSARYLKRGGRLMIAHSMSRLKLNECHRQKGVGVENDILPSDDFFKKMFHKYNFTKVSVEDSEFGFFASGKI